VVDDAKCIVVTRVCVSAAACSHYCTDPGVTWGSGRGCPLVVHYLADLQSVHGLRCYGNITRTQNVSEYMLVLALCLIPFVDVRVSDIGPNCDISLTRAVYVNRFIMAAVWNRARYYTFILWFLLLSSSFFLAYSQPSQIGCLPYFHTWCGLCANLECRSEMCCTRLAKKIGIWPPSHNFVGLYLRN